MKRELGKVSSATFCRDPDHDIPCAAIMLDFGGSVQGWQMTFRDEDDLWAWRGAVLALFNADSEARLIGQRCYALRAFDSWSEPIVGAECFDQRLIGYEWLRKREGKWDHGILDPLEQRTMSLRGDIAAAKRRIAEAEAELETIQSKYTDWTKEPLQ